MTQQPSTWEQVIKHKYFFGAHGTCMLCGLVTTHTEYCQVPKIARLIEDAQAARSQAYEVSGDQADQVEQLIWQIETDLPFAFKDDLRERIAHHIARFLAEHTRRAASQDQAELQTYSEPREKLAVWLAKRAGQDFKALHSSAQDSYKREARDLVAWLLGEPRWMAATSFASKYALLADYGVISGEQAEQVTTTMWKRIEEGREARARVLDIDPFLRCCDLKTPDGGLENFDPEECYFLLIGDHELEGKIEERHDKDFPGRTDFVFLPDEDENVEIPLKSGMTVLVAVGMMEDER